MTAYVVSSGQVFSSAVGPGDTVTVYSGGETFDVTNQGQETVAFGGSSLGDTIAAGGKEFLYGSAAFDDIYGDQYVSGPGVDDASYVYGYQQVAGLAENELVTGAGAVQAIVTGGSATNVRLANSGLQEVLSVGAASDTLVSATALQVVSSGGHAVGTLVLSGGSAIIESAGIAETVTVSAGGLLGGAGVLWGSNRVAGVASGVTVGDPNYADVLELLSGAVASNVTVAFDQNLLQVDSGASAAGAVLSYGGSEYVRSGGIADATKVLDGGSAFLEVGATGEWLIVSAGGVLNGGGLLLNSNAVAGLVENVTVGDPSHFDSLEVEAGGEASAVLVTIFGDQLQVDAGASALSTTLISSGSQLVYGVASNTSMDSGGTEYVSSGGVTVSTRVLYLGVESVGSGAFGSDVTVYVGGVLEGAGVLLGSSNVVSGGGVSGLTVGGPSGADLIVLSHGSSLAPTVISRGVETVSSGGLVSGGVVYSGGVLRLASGGVAENVTVANGGAYDPYLIVSSGQSVSARNSAVTTTTTIGGATLSAGAILSVYGATVLSGGVLSDFEALQTLTDGGLVTVASAGTVSSATVSGIGSLLSAARGATASGVVLIGGGTLSAASGALVDGLQARSGGRAALASGAIVSGLTVLSGGHVSGSGALYSGTIIVNSGGVLSGGTLAAGGLDIDDPGALETITIGNGATLELISATILSGTTLVAGLVTGVETVSGATLSPGATLELVGVTIASEGTVNIPSRGLIVSAAVQAGGTLSGPVVLEGTVPDAGKVLGALVAGAVTVASGGLLSGGIVSTVLGVASVMSGGAASSVAILGGGTMSALSGANVAALTLRPGGKALIASGDRVSGLTIYAGGVLSGSGATYQGSLDVLSGGRLSGGTLTSGTNILYGGGIESIGLASGTTLELISGFVAAGTTVTAGVAAASETMSGVTLSSGAQLELVSATVSSGATLDVLPTGRVYGLKVLAGGSLVDNGFVDETEGGIIAGALTGSGTLEETGAGTLVISSASTFTGGVLVTAGEAEIVGAGGIGSGKIVFGTAPTSTATVLIGAGAAPAAGATYATELLNFSNAHDELDLAGLAYASGATATVSGSTLVLTESGKTYDFKLAGAVASAYSVNKDAGTGTLITAGTSAAQLVQAMATFAAITGPSEQTDGSSWVAAPHDSRTGLVPAARLSHA